MNKKNEFYKILKDTYPVTEEYKYTHTSINDPKVLGIYLMKIRIFINLYRIIINIILIYI